MPSARCVDGNEKLVRWCGTGRAFTVVQSTMNPATRRISHEVCPIIWEYPGLKYRLMFLYSSVLLTHSQRFLEWDFLVVWFLDERSGTQRS